TFNENKVPLAVLLEGRFESLFKNRIKPFKTSISNDQVNSKMIVISDGDFAENQLKQGLPLELGYDKWTNNFYSNKTFLINAVHYLNDANDRIGLRSKNVNIAFLDSQKIKSKALYWKVALVFFPLISCVIFGLFNQRYRRIKYKH
ncbi:gliding motility-associated ABC transporter substrate-binding protein GldG, partial [Flavobacteriaceae bacterium]|nr:gliding motility-associated ABC transporter substrate-binding protein GldG [Flavobacteriaceae bacterium]